MFKLAIADHASTTKQMLRNGGMGNARKERRPLPQNRYYNRSILLLCKSLRLNPGDELHPGREPFPFLDPEKVDIIDVTIIST